MKVTNPDRRKAADSTHGSRSTMLAGSKGMLWRDATTESIGQIRDMTVGAGLDFFDNGDGTGLLKVGGAGGTPGTGGTPTSSAPVTMLNNAGRDLLPGDVVVVDESADAAVTVTTDAASILIAGVVQQPIAQGEKGPVLFNGFAPQVNTDTDVTRGQYAQTSSTAASAGATDDRVAGSFGVYLTGNDLADFATDTVVTETDDPSTTSLAITLPAVVPASRFLLLSLWLEDSASSPAIPGWTQIGSETGFYYFQRISTGDISDAATASWTGGSVAVAAVILTNNTVSLGVPIEDHDYDDTTSAAALSGMSSIPRYAIAGVKADAAPGAGWTVLASGEGSEAGGGTPALVQSNFTTNGSGSPDLSFPGTITQGNLYLAVPFMIGSDTWTTDPRLGIPSCGIDTAVTKLGKANTNFFGSSGINVAAMTAKTITSDTYSGPWGTPAGCLATGAGLLLTEFSGITLGSYEVWTQEGFDSSPISHTFAGATANDLLVVAMVNKADGYGGSPDPTISATGFTELVDGYLLVNGWCWAGYRVGSGVVNISYTTGIGGWAVMAVLIKGGHEVKGTLAGRYIATDAAVTSPFSGAGKEDDAIFALNLMQPARPSALLYGPDLGGSGSDVSIIDVGDYFTGTNVEDVLQELASKDIGYQSHGNMGATETFSALTGWHSGTFNADCTFTFSGATSGLVASMVLELTEDGTGGWQPTWPGSVVWSGGTPPTHDDTAGSTTLYVFESRDGGTTWYGVQVGGAGSSVAALDDLTDVTITSPATADRLRYDGSGWVNSNLVWEPIFDNAGTALLDANGDPLMQEVTV